MSSDPPLTVDETAERLKLNPETVRRMLRQGRINGFQPLSKRAGWRIPVSEIERLEHGEASGPPLPRPTTGESRRAAALAEARRQAERARARGDDEGAARFEAVLAGLAGTDTLD